MKFYDYAAAPSPRRVRIFLAEKGIIVPTVQVDLRNGEQFTDAFRAINPDCTVPVLELDSGTRLTDPIGICRYFEAVHPDPPLMGATPEEQGAVEGWQRWAERDGFYAVMEAFRNWTRAFAKHALPGPDEYEQIPALAERGRMRVARFFERLDARLAESEFLAGPRYSVADITALITIDFAAWPKLAPPENLLHLKRWRDAVIARPSAKA
jgi:glutathione S-transferase